MDSNADILGISKQQFVPGLDGVSVIPVEENCLELYCPFYAGLNQNVGEVQKSSLDWCLRFNIVSEGRKFTHLNKSKVGWLVSRAFFDADQELLQFASDWTHLFCLLDDRTEQTDSALELSRLLDGLCKAFEDGETPPWLADEPFAHALVDLHDRMAQHASDTWLAGFAQHLQTLFTAFVWERINYVADLRPDVKTYLAMRKITVGLYPLFHIGSLINGTSLPQEVLDHPIISCLMAAASNCVGWTNDLCTYEKEIEEGERHNLVLVLMNKESLSLRKAAARAARMHDEEVATFLRLERQLPSFGHYDAQVQTHIGMLRSWIRGHLEWAQETGRYRPFSRGTAEQSSGTWARAAIS